MNRLGTFSVLIALLTSLFATSVVAANGYGTSSITLNQSTVHVALGGAASVAYSVKLASGNTWGTNFVVNNQAQLQQQGIKVSPSATSGEPPFNGTISIQLSQYATAGTYTATLSATGDDPTAVNTVLTIIVGSGGSPANTTTVSSSNSGGYINTGSSGYSLSGIWPYAVAIIVILIGGILASTQKKAPSSRLIILGVVLILIGIVVWLYGDYSGGNFAYIWTGVIAILIGTVVWLMGDHQGHLI